VPISCFPLARHKPDQQQVADSILDDAEIDARMQALLR